MAALAGGSQDPRPEAALPGVRPVAGGLAVALIVSLATTVRQVRLMDMDVTVQITAHRGSCRQAPENSLSAVRQAIADGADFAAGRRPSNERWPGGPVA